MKNALTAIGVISILASSVILFSGNVSGADFPGISEIFDPSAINLPDITFNEVIQAFQGIFTDPALINSIVSITNMGSFIGDSASNVASGEPDVFGLIFIVCMLVVVMCIVSAILGWRKGKKKLEEMESYE